MKPAEGLPRRVLASMKEGEAKGRAIVFRWKGGGGVEVALIYMGAWRRIRLDPEYGDRSALTHDQVKGQRSRLNSRTVVACEAMGRSSFRQPQLVSLPDDAAGVVPAKPILTAVS